MQTVGEVMRQQVSKLQQTDYVMGREIFRKRFTGQSKYHYCPFCMERIKRAQLDYHQELKPLWVVKFKELYKVSEELGRVMYNTYWFCDVCKDSKGKPRKITTEDFINYYSADEEYSPKNKYFINLNDRNQLERF